MAITEPNLEDHQSFFLQKMSHMSSWPKRLPLFKNSEVFNSLQEAFRINNAKGAFFKVPESHDTNQPFTTQDQSVCKKG